MDLPKDFHGAYTKVFQRQTIKTSRVFVWLHNMDGVARRVTRCEPVKVREERIGVRTACAVEHDLVFKAVQQRHALVLHCCVYKRAAVRHKRIGIIGSLYWFQYTYLIIKCQEICAPGSPLPEAATGLPGTLCQTMVSCNYGMETLSLRWVVLRQDTIIFGISGTHERRVENEVCIKNNVGDIENISF